jgi:hypothetical protein
MLESGLQLDQLIYTYIVDNIKAIINSEFRKITTYGGFPEYNSESVCMLSR